MLSQRTNVLDNSSLETFGLCPRKYYYKHVLSLEAPLEAEPLTFGSAIHEALFLYYSHVGLAKNMDDVKHEAFKAFVKRATVDNSQIPITLSDDSKYSVEWGVYILEKYFEYYKDEPYTPLRDPSGNPYLELGFALDCHTGVFVGRIDGIFRDKTTDEIYVMDHKTTTYQLNTAYWDQFYPNNQVSGYLWAVQELLGIRPSGFIINAIRTYQFKRGDENTIGNKIFSRLITQRTPEQLQQRARQISWQMRIVEECKSLGLDGFVQNAPTACGIYNRRCPYTSLCIAQTEEMIGMLKGGFATRTWSPYQELEGAARVETKEAETEIAAKI
jgi:hypothetical protein